MTAKIIDGKEIAKKIRDSVKNKILKLKSAPGLDVIQVGENPASTTYVRLKQKACEEVGIIGKKHALPESTTEKELLTLIQKLNNDKKVNGILVQLPLPKQINEEHILESVSPEKDVDCFHPENVGAMIIGKKTFVPCTPAGVIKLIESEISIEGKHAVVVGRSNIVGKPLVNLLLAKNATVTICHSRTKKIEEFTRQADILISAVGKPGLIKIGMVRKGAVVIDVGTTVVNGKLTGDVDFEEVKRVASHITPVPGGVGPMTIAMLMSNTLDAYQRQNHQNI